MPGALGGGGLFLCGGDCPGRGGGGPFLGESCDEDADSAADGGCCCFLGCGGEGLEGLGDSSGERYGLGMTLDSIGLASTTVISGFLFLR